MSTWGPAVGDSITVVFCTPDEYLFRGYIVRVTTQVQQGQSPIYAVEAVDTTWVLARQLMEGRFNGIGINTAVARFVPLLYRGHVPQSLGDVPEIRFDGTTSLTAALTRLAKLVGGYWRVSPTSQNVDIFVPGGDEDGNRPTLTNSSTVRQLSLVEDATQLRNITMVVGSGGDVVSPTAAGTTSLTVTEIGWYDASSSAWGLLEGNVITFSAPEGAGQGTISSIVGAYAGEAGLPHDVPHGAILRTLGYGFDPTAVNSFGVALLAQVIQGWGLSADAVASLAWADNAMYKAPLRSIRYTTDGRWVRVGQYIGASITAPTSIVGTYVIQRITTIPRVLTDTVTSLDKTVEAGTYLKDISALLARLS